MTKSCLGWKLAKQLVVHQHMGARVTSCLPQRTLKAWGGWQLLGLEARVDALAGEDVGGVDWPAAWHH